jgi:hypothetical protein
MHLRDRGRGERRALERGEHLLDGLAEGRRKRRRGLLAGEGRHLILKLRELRRDIGRQEVGADGQGLAELHEDRAELFERFAQPNPERLTSAAEREQSPEPRERPEQMRAPDDLVEPMLHQHALDRQHATQLP